MKKELIKTERYILVLENSEVKFREWFINPKPGYEPKRFLKRGKFEAVSPKCDKIIAHLPLDDSPILEGVPLLPPLQVIEVGREEFVEYVKEKHNQERCVGFIDGYNKAREKYKFTEEDMINFACKVYNENYHKDDSFFTTAEALIKSLSQPKTPTHFEFDMKCGRCYSTDPDGDCWSAKECTRGCDFDDIMITTTNSQGQTVACGKYIY